MRILTFSSLFPNEAQPSHGVFVEHRLRQLLRYAPDIQATVVAPVPWFPFSHPRFGAYAAYAKVPREGERHGIKVLYPRYPVIPKVGMQLTPSLMYYAVRKTVAELHAREPFDLIDAHYFYPDGVAAMRLAKDLGVPFTVTGRGTDLNLIPQHYPRPRQKIQQVIAAASQMITVAGALKAYLQEMGAPDRKVTVLRNGVDLKLFQPVADRAALRARLGIDGTTLLSVGHMIERKGHHLIIDAMVDLPDCQLLLVGDGELDQSLREQVARLQLQDRVHFIGRIDQTGLREYYAAADALVLASSREGWANVLLESMACGTPVVATPVDGTPEVVADPAGGVLMRDRSAAAIADGVKALLANQPTREQTRAYAEQFSWDETSQGQVDIFRAITTG